MFSCTNNVSPSPNGLVNLQERFYLYVAHIWILIISICERFFCNRGTQVLLGIYLRVLLTNVHLMHPSTNWISSLTLWQIYIFICLAAFGLPKILSASDYVGLFSKATHLLALIGVLHILPTYLGNEASVQPRNGNDRCS